MYARFYVSYVMHNIKKQFVIVQFSLDSDVRQPILLDFFPFLSLSPTSSSSFVPLSFLCMELYIQFYTCIRWLSCMHRFYDFELITFCVCLLLPLSSPLPHQRLHCTMTLMYIHNIHTLRLIRSPSFFGALLLLSFFSGSALLSNIFYLLCTAFFLFNQRARIIRSVVLNLVRHKFAD